MTYEVIIDNTANRVEASDIMQALRIALDEYEQDFIITGKWMPDIERIKISIIRED